MRLEGTALLSQLSKCARYAPKKEEQPSGLRRERKRERERKERREDEKKVK